jgi:excisionase family DNA binding protein
VTERLLTTRDVADLLGVSPETVLRWIDTRGLSARRLTSRAIRYDPAELAAWLEGRSTSAGAAGARAVSPVHAAPPSPHVQATLVGVTSPAGESGDNRGERA